MYKQYDAMQRCRIHILVATKYETLYKDPTMCASHTRLQWIYLDAKARKKTKPEECDLVQDVLAIA